MYLCICNVFAVYFTLLSEYCTIQRRTVRWYVNAIPLQKALRGSRRLRLPEFLDNLHMKVVRLSALRTSRLYAPGDTAGHIAAGRIKSNKNPQYPFGNRT